MLPLRIAQIAPLSETVPPKFSGLHGGATERAVGFLTDELVRLGHDVTLFARGDSRTVANLCNCSTDVMGRDVKSGGGADFNDSLTLTLALEKVFNRANDFDILHFHIPPRHFPLLRRHRMPAITTLYGKLDTPGLQTYFNEFSEMSVVSLSDSQRRPLNAKWTATIPLGIPQDLFRLGGEPQGYLVFTAPICPESRVERAIEIARRSGLPIKIFSRLEPAQQAFFDRELAHLMELPFVEFKRDCGAVDDLAKGKLLGRANALLETSDQPKPFAVDLIEALACGTPIIAFRTTSTVELITEGTDGFVVDTIEAAVSRIGLLDSFPRQQCRKSFDDRFSIARTAQSYVELYEREIASHHGPSTSRILAPPNDQLWS